MERGWIHTEISIFCKNIHYVDFMFNFYSSLLEKKNSLFLGHLHPIPIILETLNARLNGILLPMGEEDALKEDISNDCCSY